MTTTTTTLKCWDCDGAGMVPAAGYEPADVVVDGHAPCSTCAGAGSLAAEETR